MISRHFLFTIFFLTIFGVSAQVEVINIGGVGYVSLTDQLPENLTSERSIVIISMPTKNKGGYEVRGDWKTLAKKVHGSIRQIGIDAIAYVYEDDLNAGPEVTSAYLKLFKVRQVENLVYFQVNGNYPNESYKLIISKYDPEHFIKSGQVAWRATHNQLDRLMVTLGRQVLRQDLDRSNFLIPEIPDFVKDIKVFDGTLLETFPSRLYSQKLAVVAFQKVQVEEPNEIIDAYNQTVEIKNNILAEIMKSYKFKYEIVEETNEDKLYDAGFQYALIPLSSTGRSIKEILNYKTQNAETHYISEAKGVNGKDLLKKIPVNANVTKYYIKQTIVKDVHTGIAWDADVSWEKALQNFLGHLKEDFDK